MTERTVMVSNALGIHARPASQIVQTATKFESRITLERDRISADAKSIMSVMMLAAAFNTKVIIRAWGKDEREAVDTITALFASKFNEE